MIANVIHATIAKGPGAMISFLKRLLSGKHVNIDALGDYSAGDWAPVPVSAAAQSANVVGWLTERPVPRKEASSGPAEPTRLRRHTIRRLYMKLKGEELVEEENTGQSLVIASMAVRPDGTPTLVDNTVPPRENDEKWVDLIKTYGEHLTEEELKIIRSQMGD